MTPFPSCCLFWARWCDLGLTPGKAGVKASSLREVGRGQPGYAFYLRAERMCWRNTASSLEKDRVPSSLGSQLWRRTTAALLGLCGSPAPSSPDVGSPPGQNSSSKSFVQLCRESRKSVPLFSVACTLPLIQFPFCLFSVQPHSAWQLFNKPICFSLTWGRSGGCWRAIRP